MHANICRSVAVEFQVQKHLGATGILGSDLLRGGVLVSTGTYISKDVPKSEANFCMHDQSYCAKSVVDYNTRSVESADL